LLLERQFLKVTLVTASITYGQGSSQRNGYRDDLYRLLERDGNVVNMVGNNPAVGSTFKDKDTEGWKGFTIDQVAGKMRASMPKNRPNIVTLLVGTNDMWKRVDLPNAPARLGKLIDGVLNFPPLTMVIVSSLPPNSDAKMQARINSYNAALPGVVQKRAKAGKWVLFADCGKTVKVSDLVDGTHPNDAGYERIGRCFYDAIVAGEKKGWVSRVQGSAP
jgi:lysophospholipase L1-like esterase